MNTIYLLLGSNEGNRKKWLVDATKELKKDVGNIVTHSSIYSTAAWGIEEQPDFLNIALKIETTLTPNTLIQTILFIEKKLGRERKLKWGQRTIDIDILFYNDEKIETNLLTVPHPYIHKRRFALVPLVEIAPKFQHPTLNKTMTQLLDNCTDKLPVTKIEE